MSEDMTMTESVELKGLLQNMARALVDEPEAVQVDDNYIAESILPLLTSVASFGGVCD